MAVLAGGGSRASWFVGYGEWRLSVGGRRRLWEWILAGDRSRAVGGRCGCHLCRSIGTARSLGAAVAGCGRCWLGGSFVGGTVIFVGGRFMGSGHHHGQTT